MDSNRLPLLQSPKRPGTRAIKKQLAINLTYKDGSQEMSTFRNTTYSRSNIMPQTGRIKTHSDVSYLNFRNDKVKMSSLSSPKIPLSSIAKDPQYYEFHHNQQNKSNIYATIVKDKMKGTFIENPKELEVFEKTIDFSPLLQNIKINQFRYYLQSIMQQECNTIFDSKAPPNRQQAIDLLLWFEKMINNLNTDKSLLITDITNQLQVVYQSCLHELARQVSYECKERGMLLLIIWNSFVSFIEMLIQNVASNYNEMEIQQMDALQRIQKTQQSLVSQLQEEIFQLKQQISDLETQKNDLNEKNIYLAKKSLQLTNDIKFLGQQLDEMTDNHNKVYKELLETKLQIETHASSQTTQKIKIGIQEGQSVVAHLLEMKNTMFRKMKKQTSIQYEKGEQLKEDEEYFKQGLSKTDLDSINNTFQQQNQLNYLKMQPNNILLEEKECQTDDDWLQDYSDSMAQKQEIQINRMMAVINQMKMHNKPIDCREVIQHILSNGSNQDDDIVMMKKKQIEQMLEIQEQKVNAKYFEQTLQEATQEFIELLKKKKKKIRELKKSQTMLQNRLNSLQSEGSPPRNEIPKVLVTSPGIKTPSFQNSAILDQQDILKEDIIEGDEKSEESANSNQDQQQDNGQLFLQDQDEIDLVQNPDQEGNQEMLKQENEIESEQKVEVQLENQQVSNESKSRKSSISSKSKVSSNTQNQQQKNYVIPQQKIKNKKSLIINSLTNIDDDTKLLKRSNTRQFKLHPQRKSININTTDGSSEINESMSLISSDDSQDDKDKEAEQRKLEKIRNLVKEYGGANIQKRRHTKPLAIKLSLLSDLKKERRVKRVYSQNTDAANSLLHEIMNPKQKKQKDSIIPIASLIKIFNTIITDTAKNPEGYKIPLHVSIYDFFLKKYGFKNVAEKKIKQLFQFIYNKKSQYSKLCLISRLCYMDDEMDEAVYKLIVESIKYFHSKEIQLNRQEIILTLEQMTEYCNEFLLQLLGQTYIQQLQLQLKQSQNKVIIFEQIMIQVMNLYFQKKKQCEDSLKLIFQAADLDGNNLIEFSEFKNLYKAIHPNIYDKNIALEQFISYADYIEELSKNKMITLPRFAEMAIELNLFSKEQIHQYSKGYENLFAEWEEQKNFIKFRYLKAEKFPKVKFTFNLLTEQINLQKKKQNSTHDLQTLWVGFKLLQEKSQRVVLNHEARECFFDLVPSEIYYIQQAYRAIEDLCI